MDANTALTLTQMARDGGGRLDTPLEEDEEEEMLSEPGEEEEEEEGVLGVSDDEELQEEQTKNEVGSSTLQ